MKFIMLNGPSCSGKSTLVKKIMADKERFYQLSYDSQKWLFSKYDRNVQFNDVRTILKSLAETVCKMQYNIICDSALYRKEREELLTIPRKHGYEIIEINLDGDYEILAKRFDERIKSALSNPDSKISNTSHQRFKELYNIFQTEKNSSAITIKTDVQSSEETAAQVLKLIS